MSEPLELQELAVSLALAAGDFLADRPSNFELNEKTSINDFATQMYLASEKLIVDSILKARPDDGILGEEGTHRESRSGVTWVIDPLDGTVNYFYGLPGWNVSIAAKQIRNGVEKVITGAVYSPTTQSLWYASHGGGAFWRSRGKTIQIH